MLPSRTAWRPVRIPPRLQCQQSHIGGRVVGKWLAGVAASVAATLIVWVITQDGGSGNGGDGGGGGGTPPTAAPAPSVGIGAFNGPSFSQVGQQPTASITVNNDGDAAAVRCRIFWSPFTKILKRRTAK